MNDSEKLTKLWNVLHPDVMEIEFSKCGRWIARANNFCYSLEILDNDLFPAVQCGVSRHTRPVDKADLLRQVEEQLANIWPYIKPGYDWLAADLELDGLFDWYCYNHKPARQENNVGEWKVEDDCLPLYGLHITIPDGLEWHDLIFERPK